MDNKQWFIVGAVALGALLLMPKKRKRRSARGPEPAMSEIRLNTKKRCVPDITRKKIRCRVQEPKEFDGFFTRKSTTPGVEYVMGFVDGKGITQSVLFDKKIWSQPLAKNWFNKNIKRLLQRDKQALNMG